MAFLAPSAVTTIVGCAKGVFGGTCAPLPKVHLALVAFYAVQLPEKSPIVTAIAPNSLVSSLGIASFTAGRQ